MQLFKLILPLLLTLPLFANADPAEFPRPQPPLNKVSYQTTVEKWATTDTVKVTVSMDAALDKVGLANVNSHVLDTLNKMAAKADWHITTFTRSQDKSGLEMLHVEAEARLPQGDTAGLRDKAKSISKPGETYTISDIDFSPSLAEMEKTHADARAAIYANIQQEIMRLNQAYPEQHYFLHSIEFVPNQPVIMRKGGMVMAAAMPEPNQEQPSMPVNANVTETAQVVIAAKAPTTATPK